MKDVRPIKVLFVCLGNICRSPTAEGVMRHKVRQAGLEAHILLDSAGTGGWHVGKAPDPRMQQAALERGYDLSTLRARQVSAEDLQTFDYVLAMDDSNYSDLKHLAGSQAHAKLQRLLDYGATGLTQVPDPYYGGEAGFFQVIDLIEQACDALLDHLRTTHAG